MDRTPTGISELDELLFGGLPRPSAIGIVGEVGSGKSILCRQIAWNLLRNDYYVLYYTTDEGTWDVENEMLSFGWNIRPYEEKNKIHFIDLFSKAADTLTELTEKGIPEEAVTVSYDFKFLVSSGKEYYFKAIRGKKLLVIFDSITSLFMYWDPKLVLRFVQIMKFASRISHAVGVATLHSGVHNPDLENACKHIADGVIELTTNCPSLVRLGEKARYLRILKMPYTRTTDEFYLAEITSGGLRLGSKVPLSHR